MSFNMNPNINLSNVQASAKSCPGGGGNTGYFQRGEKEEDVQFKTSNYPDDSFEKIDGTLDEIQNQSFWTIIKNLILDIFNAIKSIFVSNTDSENKEEEE